MKEPEYSAMSPAVAKAVEELAAFIKENSLCGLG